MTLLKAVRYETVVREPPGISSLVAWIGGLISHNAGGRLVVDGEGQWAVLAANVNVIRREAPYAYLFASGDGLEVWREDDFGDDLWYIRTLPERQLSRGVYLTYPEHQKPTTTIVVDIGTGDVLPVVGLIEQEEFALLCLPVHLSLEEIDRRVALASSNREAMSSLLSGGGCVVTAIDGDRFAVRTLDPARYLRYFRPERSEAEPGRASYGPPN